MLLLLGAVVVRCKSLPSCEHERGRHDDTRKRGECGNDLCVLVRVAAVNLGANRLLLPLTRNNWPGVVTLVDVSRVIRSCMGFSGQ